MGAVEVVAADWMHEAEFFAPASSMSIMRELDNATRFK